jgi:peroxiredoxin Q/BCP
MIKYLCLLCTFLFSAYCYAKPKVGDLAPLFNVPEFNLEEARGKVVVLYFYPKDYTSSCTVEAQRFAAYFDDFKALNAEIIGVSTDSTESHQGFKKKCNLPFTLISDDGTLTEMYDVAGVIWTQRATFLIDKAGKIAYVWSSVNVAQHAQEVLAKIKELNL